MTKSLLPALLLCLAAVQASAAVLDLDFNDSSVQLGFAHNLSEDEYGSARGRLRLLYNDHEETTLGSAGLDFAGSPGNVPGLEVGIGAQLLGGEADRGQDLLALAVGVQATWAPPILGGFGLGGRVAYAPEIFCWLDSERVVESAARLSYAVTPRATLFLEYQNIRSDFEDHGNWTIDDDLRGGFEARF
jgi:hypothetical protein